MSLSKEVQLILERSSTLSERLSDQFQPLDSRSQEIEERLNRWQQVIGFQERFHKRLMWDDFTPSTIRSKLGLVRWQGQNPPAWTVTLEKIFAIAQSHDQTNLYDFLVEVARQELEDQIGDLISLLSDPVYQSLESSLVERLTTVCDRVIYDRSDCPTLYETLLTLFQEYSVLARLIAHLIDIWVSQIAKFLQDLAKDTPHLKALYKSPLGQIVTIKLRETSGCQRNFIAIVTFASGLKLVYKSSPLGIQSAYEQLLLWFNQSQTLPLKFKTLKILNHDRGGWIEYVEHLSCCDQAAVKRYYQRTGMLLCLVYALSGIDCHSANLIACGEYPVLIDTETLLQPQLARAPNSGELSDAEMQAHHIFIESSVIRTGFLPVWKVQADHQAFDGSSLGGTCKEDQHRPTLNGEPVALQDYESDLIEGFQQMYHFLLKQRDQLLTQNSRWMNLTRHPVRFLFRSNRIYESIVHRSLQPEFLRSGIERSIELDILSRAFLAQVDKPKFWNVLHVEVDAIGQLEIPHFQASSDQTHLMYNNSTIVQSYFERSGAEAAKSRLNRLSPQDLHQQIQWIRGSIYAHQIQPDYKSKDVSHCSDRSFTPAQAIDAAIQIAQQFQQQAIYGSDGSTTWIGLTTLVEVQKIQLQPIDDSLFQGSCGIALFLGALAKLTGDSTWQDLALSTIQPLCQRLNFTSKHPNNQWIRTTNAELGGYIYSLTRLSQFLDRPDLLEYAQLASNHINSELSTFGLLSGLSGAILGLLALHKATDAPLPMHQALQCGETLLNNYQTWSGIPGFAYGRSGVAYALLQIFLVSQDSRFLEMANPFLSSIVLSEFDDRAEHRNGFYLCPRRQIFHPGFFQGLAGIGYTHLRLAHPEIIPSVLLWN
ncbi:type 2 lanthipeptide synthetase LanM [Leptolyngbya boryana CZ1]|uniref:Type 2 lanthipeptide synthetase LanM n=1 Tax=Leptolyngbya boryana CZ1 TaxID=3060204 RepID=A0AA96X1F4_LEPBY|nr:type 2 lanthipeptide synthetase LanM [Leptolyngbya boryana]WNZ43775.1 type 2 lanthipeptide synthetase LanM [Leptolyngbya boryana CZ1]